MIEPSDRRAVKPSVEFNRPGLAAVLAVSWLVVDDDFERIVTSSGAILPVREVVPHHAGLLRSDQHTAIRWSILTKRTDIWVEYSLSPSLAEDNAEATSSCGFWD
jgi:hypothetical protein